jgi:hypothetical protein
MEPRENTVYLMADSRPNVDSGSVEIYGVTEKAGGVPGRLMAGRITIQSQSFNDDPTLEGMRRAMYQEMAAIYLELGTYPARNLTPDESNVHDNIQQTNTLFRPLNVHAGIGNNSPLYRSIPNDGKYTNANILPHDWNVDYSAIRTACDLFSSVDCGSDGY